MPACFFLGQGKGHWNWASYSSGVEAALAAISVFVGALLHHIAVPHHQDAVGVLDGGKPVGDDKAGLVPSSAPAWPAWICISVRVSTLEVASSRISIWAIQQHGPGNGEQLLLALGDVARRPR